MTGPYTAQVFLGIEGWRVSRTATPDFTLTWEDNRDMLEHGQNIAWQFYSRGGGATLEGTLRAATFAVGTMLDRGETAYIRLVGRDVARGDDHAFAGDVALRRDSQHRILSTLGSKRGHERAFNGV